MIRIFILSFFLFFSCAQLESAESFVPAPWKLKKTTPMKLMDEEEDLKTLLFKIHPSLERMTDPLEIAKTLIPIITEICIDTCCNDPNYTTSNFHQLSAQQYYCHSIKKRYGEVCGGRNTFFKKILNELFGIDAFTLNMGIANKATHVVVIIPVQQEYQTLYYLFDSYYCCYFTDTTGNHLDLEAIFKGDPFEVKVFNFPSYCIINGKSFIFYNFDRIPLMKKIRSYPTKNCHWKDTVPLEYLGFGELLSLSRCSSYYTHHFQLLLDRYQVGQPPNFE